MPQITIYLVQSKKKSEFYKIIVQVTSFILLDFIERNRN